MELPVINKISTDIKDLTIYLRSIKKFGKSTLFRDTIIAKYGDPCNGLLAQCGKEKGVKLLDNVNSTRIRSYEDVIELKEYLVHKRLFERDEKGKVVKGKYVPAPHNIKIVCFDTVDELVPFFEAETIRISNIENPSKKVKTINAAMGGYQEGQKYAANMIKDYLEEIVDAGIGVWAIAHTKFKTIKEKGGLEEDGYQQLTSNLVSAYEAAFGDIFDVTLTGVIDRNVEIRGEGDNAKRYATDEVRKLYFRGTTLIDAGGRFADGAVPEYLVFDKGNMGSEFVKTVEEGMEKSKTELSKRPKATTHVKAATTESTPTPTVQEEEVPFAEDDIDDIDTPVTEETSSDYPEDLDGVIRAMFKECKNADLKAKVKAVIAEYGKLNDVDEDGLKKIYDMMK